MLCTHFLMCSFPTFGDNVAGVHTCELRVTALAHSMGLEVMDGNRY